MSRACRPETRTCARNESVVAARQPRPHNTSPRIPLDEPIPRNPELYADSHPSIPIAAVFTARPQVKTCVFGFTVARMNSARHRPVRAFRDRPGRHGRWACRRDLGPLSRAPRRRTPASGRCRTASRRSCPQSTAVPSERRISAPAPAAKYGGTMWMKHAEVIRIGRSRHRAASTAASNRDAPSCCAVAGELDDQDGVLARQADQHHEADLHEDVDVHAADTRRRRWRTASTSARPGSPPAAATSSRTGRPARRRPAPPPARTR